MYIPTLQTHGIWSQSEAYYVLRVISISLYFKKRKTVKSTKDSFYISNNSHQDPSVKTGSGSILAPSLFFFNLWSTHCLCCSGPWRSSWGQLPGSWRLADCSLFYPFSLFQATASLHWAVELKFFIGSAFADNNQGAPMLPSLCSSAVVTLWRYQSLPCPSCFPQLFHISHACVDQSLSRVSRRSPIISSSVWRVVLLSERKMGWKKVKKEGRKIKERATGRIGKKKSHR